MAAIITLTTDFEEREPYVASVKGVLCTHAPGVQIVDLSHDIPRANVREAALFLVGAAPYFPAGTIHIAAVASGARPIAVSICDQIVLCPDNGVITLLADGYALGDVRAITETIAHAATDGQLYFARDVFAPAAARLACGGVLSELGPKVDDVTKLELARPIRVDDRTIQGQIIHINRFGSLVTNIHRSVIAELNVVKIVAGAFPIGRLSTSYSDVAPGKPLALIGSSQYLEIAYNGDRADARLHLDVGIAVTVSFDPARA
jgi:S-adenosylmethionine hydrolase